MFNTFVFVIRYTLCLRRPEITEVAAVWWLVDTAWLVGVHRFVEELIQTQKKDLQSNSPVNRPRRFSWAIVQAPVGTTALDHQVCGLC